MAEPTITASSPAVTSRASRRCANISTVPSALHFRSSPVRAAIASGGLDDFTRPGRGATRVVPQGPGRSTHGYSSPRRTAPPGTTRQPSGHAPGIG